MAFCLPLLEIIGFSTLKKFEILHRKKLEIFALFPVCMDFNLGLFWRLKKFEICRGCKEKGGWGLEP